jgi:Delta3-Delta2-enoyl-CoA isomerase
MMRLAMRLLQRGSGISISPVIFLRKSRHHHYHQRHHGVTALFSTTTPNNNNMDEPPPLVLTKMHHPAKGVATIIMNNMPVNSLSLEMLTALSQAIKQVENEGSSDAASSSSFNNSIQSLILTSSKYGIFSAGLDIKEMHNPNMERLHHFWYAFQQLYIDLYGSRLACIAAIPGNAPAAGCMLALSCDYRIMATTTTTTTTTTTATTANDNSSSSSSSSSSNDNKKKPLTSSSSFTIGLNETKLGIAAPSWLARQFRDTIGQRQAELGLSLGLLYTPEQALDIGLVDELVPMTTSNNNSPSDDDALMTRAEQVALEWAHIPPQARVASKMLMRKEAIDHLMTNRQADADHFINFVTNTKVQQNLTSYLEMLASKRKK